MDAAHKAVDQQTIMELFAITNSEEHDSIEDDKVYPTRQSAEARKAQLEVEAAKLEEEDWRGSPCTCGDRRCDYRSYLFPCFSIKVLSLAI